MIAINTQLSSAIIPAPSDLELTAIHLDQHQLTVCAVYISPNSSIDYHNKLYNYLSTLPYNEHVLLIGDFNTPDIATVGHLLVQISYVVLTYYVTLW